METDIILWLQDHHIAAVDALMVVPTVLGSAAFYAVALPFVFLMLGPRRGFVVATIMVSSFTAMQTIKAAVAAPRPFQTLGFEPLYHDSASASFSFPSGHAMGTTTFWTLVALLARRPAVTALAIVLVLWVMFSRVYVGVHWPHDVVAGALFALAIAVPMHAFLLGGDVSPRAILVVGALVAVASVALGVINERNVRMGALVLGLMPALAQPDVRPDRSAAAFWWSYVLPAVAVAAGIIYGLGAVLPEHWGTDAALYLVAALWLSTAVPRLYRNAAFLAVDAGDGGQR